MSCRPSPQKPRPKVRTMAATRIPVASEPTHEQISARAYEIYIARGTASGGPHADWVQAETEIRARLALLGRP